MIFRRNHLKDLQCSKDSPKVRQQKAKSTGSKNYFSIIHLDPDRESSTSLIDAAFIKLTSDNDEKTERTGKIKFAPHQSQGKKEE